MAGKLKVTTHFYPSMGFVGVVTRAGKHVFDGAPGRTRASARKKALAQVRREKLNNPSKWGKVWSKVHGLRTSYGKHDPRGGRWREGVRRGARKLRGLYRHRRLQKRRGAKIARQLSRRGWRNPGNGSGKHVVARWESRGGKRWLELYRDQMGHTYHQDGGGGNLGGGLTDAEAIAALNRGMLGAMKSDHPSTKRVKNPLPRWVHRKSIRTIYRGKGFRRRRILVGCPKRSWQVRKKRCRRGMRLVEKRRAYRAKLRKKYPGLWKRRKSRTKR